MNLCESLKNCAYYRAHSIGRPAPLDSRSRRSGLFENTKRSSAYDRRTQSLILLTHSVWFDKEPATWKILIHPLSVKHYVPMSPTLLGRRRFRLVVLYVTCKI